MTMRFQQYTDRNARFLLLLLHITLGSPSDMTFSVAIHVSVPMDSALRSSRKTLIGNVFPPRSIAW